MTVEQRLARVEWALNAILAKLQGDAYPKTLEELEEFLAREDSPTPSSDLLSPPETDHAPAASPQATGDSFPVERRCRDCGHLREYHGLGGYRCVHGGCCCDAFRESRR